MRRKPARQKVSNKRSNLTVALLALSFCALLILSAKTFKFLYSFSQPINQNLATNNASTISSNLFSYNVALVAKDLAVINVDPKNRKITILSIPENTYISIPKGYGNWPIMSAYKLGQSENPQIGALLIQLSLQKLLGLPIDRVIALNDSKTPMPTSSELIKKWSGNSLISYLTMPKIQTNLSPKEKLAFLNSISSTREDKLKLLDLYQTSITQNKLMPDSSRVLGVNTIKLDLFIRDEMFDQQIFSESIPVAIYNATGKPNIASDLARIVTNLGGSVIIINNTADVANKSVLFATEPLIKSSATFKRLSYLVSPNCLEEDCKFEDPNVDRSRAKITIVLGEDYYLANY